MTTSSLTDTLRETLALFDEPGAPLTTTEVADRLGLGRRSTYERLDRLVDHGALETKVVGANGRVWWQPAEGSGRVAPDWSAAAQSLVDDALDSVDVGLFVLDENFDVAWINEATERYFGLDRDRVLGRDKRALVEETIAPTVADSTTFAERVLATYDDNTDTERFECRVTAGEGRESRWLEHRSKPIESGAYAGGRVELYYDVTDQKQSERAREDDRRQFLSLVEAVEEYAIFVLDADGHVETWNPGAERIKGYDADDIVGEHFSTFYTDDDRSNRIPERNLAEAARRGSVEDEGWRVRADGSLFWANVTITALRDDDGELDGFAKVTRDMTERREYEQRLQDEIAFTQSLLDNQRDIIYALDEDGSLLRWNDRFEAVTGYTASQIEGMHAAEFISETTTEDAMDAIRRVLDEGESVTVELQFETEAGRTIPYEFTGNPLRDEDGAVTGVAGIGRDISERKAKERRLQRQRADLERELEDIFDRISDGFFGLDDQLRFTYLNDRAQDILGVTEVGQDIRSVLDPTDDFEAALEEALSRQEPIFLEDYYEPLDVWFESSIHPSESGLSVYFRDVTERREYERTLEEYQRRYRTFVENFPNGAVALVDQDLRYVTFGGTPEGDMGVTRDDLEGECLREVLPPELADVVIPGYEAALDGDPSRFEETVGDRVYRFQFVPIRDEDGNVTTAMAMSQDITESKERERALREAKAQLEAATEASEVGTWEWHIDEDRLVAGPSFAETFGIDPEEARRGVPLDRALSAIHEDDRSRVERGIEAAVSTRGGYEEEYRVRDGDGELRWVVARGRVECDDAGDPVSFPGAFTDITERKRAEMQLERQRERLAALNSLNEVVQDITTAAFDQSTREEIERVVCEGLADADSYEFAWIGEADLQNQSIVPRIEAGVDGYVDEVPLSIDPDELTGRGPAGRAIRTGEMQVTEDTLSDPDFEPWREMAKKYGYRSSAGIPIVHGGTTYGLLCVYADRPDAFSGEEGSVIAQIGEIVGHAIAATERKRALMTDEVVELEFQIRDVLEAVDADVSPAGSVTIDHTVPIGNGEYLGYGTATPDAVDTVEAIVEAVPHWGDVTFHRKGETVEFEVRLSEPPVLSTVTDVGGSVERAVIEDGNYRMTIHAVPGSGVGQIIDAVRETYPSAQLLKRHQISRRDGTAERVQNVLTEGLTDRQRSALEVAFHAGFFEWPRDASGEEVAESLGVAAPTFHQHLRKAERAVFSSLLADSAST